MDDIVETVYGFVNEYRAAKQLNELQFIKSDSDVVKICYFETITIPVSCNFEVDGLDAAVSITTAQLTEYSELSDCIFNLKYARCWIRPGMH